MASWSLMRSKLILQGRKFTLAVATVMLALGLSACTTSSQEDQMVFDPPLNSHFSIDNRDVILTQPDLAEREQYQLIISHLTQLLGQRNATHEQKAQILYQLGVLYDRLGLDVTARTMFMSALIEVPDYAQVYNFLGIYLASNERFSEAYDAYDSVLEIDPEETYAYFNRGIALYYGNRAELGISDLEKFYEADPNDPFRMAWLYILERTVHGEEYAKTHLAERRSKVDKEVPWGLEVLDYYLGKINSHQLIDIVRQSKLDKVELGRRLCEAYFYMAKIADFEGDYKRAYDLFHLCISTSVSGYLEYRYALLEVGRYERLERVAKADQLANAQQEQRDSFLKKQADEARKYFEELQKQQPSPQLVNPSQPNTNVAPAAAPVSEPVDDSLTFPPEVKPQDK